MTERAPDCPQAPLDAALEAYPDPVRLIGAEGRVLYRNRAARESLPEGLGHRCGGDPGAGSSDCPACGVWRTAEDGQLRRWHVVVDPPPSSEGERSDARRYYEVTLTRVPLEGGRWGVVEFVRDVTITFGLEHTLAAEADRLEHEITRRAAEIEQLEKRTDEMRTLLARLRQSQMEAMARDRTMVLGQMAAALAHEIHTPLGALIASVEVLEHGLSKLRQAAAESDDAHTSRTVGARLESLDNAVGIVCEASRRIEQLVRSMRLFTRVDEGARKRVDLHAGIESSMTLLGHQTRDRIRFVRSFGELPEVVCRPSAINQVFLNLLLNAVQAIEGRGQIEIRTRADRDQAVIEIIDTGEGISPEDLPRVFEAGFTTRKRGLGTGLGLAISERIVQEHGGSIQVTSEPKRGSTFTIRLPLWTTASSAENSSERSPT